jgi:uncharacterized protein (DUF2252 family)
MGNDEGMETPDSYATPEERVAAGLAARKRHPRAAHANWEPPANRQDPIDVLVRQGETRVHELLPIRYGRMAVSPFTFYRGAAAVMAADLADNTNTGLRVQLCGDAHLSNFGGFASPERDMVFDVNDFDETLPGPFEWDVKRLAASLEVAGRGNDCSSKERRFMVTECSRSYRQSMAEFAAMSNLDIWYSHLDDAGVVARWGAEAGRDLMDRLAKTVAKAETKDHLAAFNKLTERVDGEVRFRSDPPLLVPAAQLFEELDRVTFEEFIEGSLQSYRRTLSADRRGLLDRYRFVDLARKVVGVGSVGTRCWVALLIGRDDGDPLFLQVKQAENAVSAPFAPKSRYTNQGQRVVEGQRIMQASSDILLWWDRILSPDGVTRDYYTRQLWDWKASVNIERLDPSALAIYAQICGWTLARAHARSGDAIAISSYLGTGDRFDRALAEFSSTYADQNERDHHELVSAIKDGRLEATKGV